MRGDGGGDILFGDGERDTLDGGSGADKLSGGPGSDELHGGAEQDEVRYTGEADVTVRLDAGRATTGQWQDTIMEVEDVSGGSQRDTLTVTKDPNDLGGGPGADYVDGRRGKDQLFGGRSPDVVASRDRVSGEPVSCGPGEDFAIVDRRDRLARGRNRCEEVDDGSERKPKPGLVYAQPQPCGESAEEVELGLPAMHLLVPLRYSIMLPSGYRRRPAPTLDAADCGVTLTATTARGQSASAELSGDAVKVRQASGRRRSTELTIKPPPSASGECASPRAAGRPP